MGEDYQLFIIVKIKMTRHNLFTIGFWACIAITGAVQALSGHISGDFTWVIACLGAAEHYFAGNIS